jgi:hypothetical protein
VPGDDASGLARLQAEFVAAVLRRAPGVGERLATTRVPVDTALGIYRTNARANFANALAAAFPALHALLGTDDWASLCWTCQRARPSRSGDLFAAGAELAAFLAASAGGTPRALLADLATLEWSIQQVLVAADADGAPDLAALAGVPAERHGDLRVALVPAHALVVVAGGTAAAWERLRDPPSGAAPAGALPLPGAGREALLVQRAAAGLRVVVLEPGEHAFLAALAAGAPLAAAIAAGTAAAPGFAADAALAAVVRRGLVTGFVLPS